MTALHASDWDRDAALTFFTSLKTEVDRPAVPSRLDLDKQRVVPGREGYLLNVYDCLVATDLALRRGSSSVALAVKVIEPGRRYKDLELGHVLGSFETVYSLADRENYYIDKQYRKYYETERKR